MMSEKETKNKKDAARSSESRRDTEATQAAQARPEEPEKKKIKKGTVIRLAGYLKPYKKTLFVVLVLVLAITVLELYKPILIGNAIDEYITGDYEAGEMVKERFTGVIVAAVQYLIVLVVLFIFSRIQYLMIETTGQKIIYDMRNELFAHMETLSMRYFDLTPVGTVVTRITNDVEALNDLFSKILVRLVKNATKIVGIAAMMLILDVHMALFSFCMVPFVVLLIVILTKLSRQAYNMIRTRLTVLNTFLSENLSGMKIIQIFAREKEKHEEFKARSRELYQANFREMMVYAVFQPLIFFLSRVALTIVLWGGSGRVFKGVLTLGTLYVFVEYITTFFDPIQSLAEQFSTLQSAFASADKIFTLLDEQPMVTDPEEPKKLGAVKGRIEFKHVWFAYDGEDYVLKDISFTIEPGQRVAFVGATGAGKSSILNVLGRYYDIQKGEILIDGVNIKDLSQDELRSIMGQVQQDVLLLTGDINSNIRLYNEDITDEEIRKAAHEVNADRFVDRLPDGYRERVTERGATFSAGERQLLSFARTLAFDPELLILDEATANIDTETEQWIQEALERLMTGRTTILVAHRLSTIQHADRIIVMHHGRIRESGTHQELLELNGIYKKLYDLQLA